MADMMTFPDTVEEFMEQYKITDTEHIYTNGTELVPIFRMRQWFDHKSEPHWIPCSERLPQKTGEYLVTKISIGWNYEEYTENDVAYWDNHKGFCKTEKVIAWMPIPEPYKEGATE